MKKIYCILFSAVIVLTSSFIALSATATMGDVNSDNKINSQDALLILKCSVGSEIPSNFDYGTADLNADDIINSSDALIVLKISVGLLEPSTITKEDISTTRNTVTTPITVPNTSKPTSVTPTSEPTTITTIITTTVPHSENYHGHVYTGGSSSKKYHYEAECAGKYSHEITWDEVSARGLEPCKTCVLK